METMTSARINVLCYMYFLFLLTAVKTFEAPWGGTDARVWIKIEGTSGETDGLRLHNPNHDDFER